MNKTSRNHRRERKRIRDRIAGDVSLVILTKVIQSIFLLTESCYSVLRPQRPELSGVLQGFKRYSLLEFVSN